MQVEEVPQQVLAVPEVSAGHCTLPPLFFAHSPPTFSKIEKQEAATLFSHTYGPTDASKRDQYPYPK